jgi:hypothetical protein
MLDGVESERRNNTDGITRQLTMKLGEESEREESIREAGEEDSAMKLKSTSLTLLYAHAAFDSNARDRSN